MNQCVITNHNELLTCSDIDTEIKDGMEINTIQDSTFQMQDYIPKKSYRNLLKPCLIISSLLVLVIVVIIIITSSNKKEIIKNKKIDDHLPHTIILHDDDCIYYYYPSNKTYQLIYKNEKTIRAFTAYSTGIIFSIQRNFSIDRNISQIYYLPNEFLNSTLQNSNIIFEEARVKPYAMEIDVITKNLYIIDNKMKSLIVLNIETKYHNLLLTHLKNPTDIILDATEGLMFILQKSDSIIKASMDGNDLVKIIEDSDITLMTVDRKTKRIYWVSSISNIESSTYNGENRTNIITDSLPIISLTIVDNQLYWLLPIYGSSNSTLLSCKIDNVTCSGTHNFETVNFLQNPKLIKSITYQHRTFSNPYNHSCQHISMQTPGNRHSCTCNLGWELHSDQRSCRQVTDFILYEKGNFIRGRILDINKKSAVDVIWPTPVKHRSFSRDQINFAYDFINDVFYFTDLWHLYSMKLKNLSSQTILLTNKWMEYYGNIAYDKLTGNLYYIIRNSTDNHPHSLMMFNVKLGRHFQKNLTNFIHYKSFSFNGCPDSMILDLYHNYIFTFRYIYDTDEKKNKSIIDRFSMNGTELYKIELDYVVDYIQSSLTVDFINERIYRILKSDSDIQISHVKFDGTGEKVFTVNSVGPRKFILVHQQWLYICNGVSVWRVHKETGKGAVKISFGLEANDDEEIRGIRIISPFIGSTTRKMNFCSINNGGCEEFCFNGPKVSCGCKDGQSIQDDGRCFP